MPRKRKELSDSYNKAFPVALRKLMDKRGTTQNELANHLGVSRQSISYYCDGSSSPDWEAIARIADYYDVTTDYLLGRVPDPDRHPCAAEELGLSIEAVKNIIECSIMNHSDDVGVGLNMLLEQKNLFLVAGQLGYLSRWILHEKKRITDRLAREYDPTGKDSGLAPDSFSEILDEDLQEELIDEITSNHPEFKGCVDLRIGRSAANAQIYDMITQLDTLIRLISGYYDLIP